MKNAPSINTITVEFLDELENTLSSATSINEAVVNRHIFKDRETNLESYKDDFDASGQTKPDAKFKYHDEERVKEVRERYLRTDMSDREVIAFDACYFDAGRNTMTKYIAECARDMAFASHLKYMIPNVSTAIANELRDSVGFQSPTGYIVHDSFKEKVTALKANPELIALQISTAEKLKSIAAEIIKKSKTQPPQNIDDITAHVIESDPHSDLGKMVRNYEKLKTMHHELTSTSTPPDQRVSDFLNEFKKWRDDHREATFRLSRWASPDPTYAFWHKEIKPFYKEMEKRQASVPSAGKGG